MYVLTNKAQDQKKMSKKKEPNSKVRFFFFIIS
jgi:hypothetical protein